MKVRILKREALPLEPKFIPILNILRTIISPTANDYKVQGRFTTTLTNHLKHHPNLYREYIDIESQRADEKAAKTKKFEQEKLDAFVVPTAAKVDVPPYSRDVYQCTRYCAVLYQCTRYCAA